MERVEVCDLEFSYRSNSLPSDAVITGASFRLSPGDRDHIRLEQEGCLAERRKRQPLQLPSAGSVFKNPPGSQSAGALIEACGLKGERCGAAEVSTLHANWIVNAKRKAKAEEVCRLISHIQRKVEEEQGVCLKPEVIPWGLSL